MRGRLASGIWSMVFVSKAQQLSPITLDPQQAQASAKKWMEQTAHEAEGIEAREDIQNSQREKGETSCEVEKETERPSRVRAKPGWLKDFVALLEY